jgi:HJR/Mrr/RecB family endonuclease
VGNDYRPRKRADRWWLVLRARQSTLLLFVLAVLVVVVLFATVIAAVAAVTHNEAYAGAAGLVFIMLVVPLTVWMVERAAHDRRAAASRASGRGRTPPLFGVPGRTPATSAMSLPGQAERIQAQPFRSEERKRLQQAPPEREWFMGLVTTAGLDAPSHVWIQLDKFDPAVNHELKTKLPGPFKFHSASMRWVLPLNWETCTGARAIAEKFNATIKITDPMFDWVVQERERQDEERKRQETWEQIQQAIDVMEGREFENYVAERLRQVGWTVEATSATGDFGVDLIAEKDGRRVAVQCKRLSHAVGVGAVQQVVSGGSHHNCFRTAVVSNQEFTEPAKQLARTHNCQLVGRAWLLKEWPLTT